MSRVWTLATRGVLLRCPNCGKATLVRGLLQVHDRCRVCGLLFEHDEGFFLGALVLNYMVTALVGIIPAIVAVATGTWSVPFAIGFAALASVLFPILFYWHAKSLWLATYYTFVPDDLKLRDIAPEGPLLDLASLTPEQRQRLEIERALAELEGGRPGTRPNAR